MKKLTIPQITAIQELANYPQISRVDLEFFPNNISQITIVSAINVEWNDVDKAINDELDETFPNLEYYGLPCKYSQPGDESETRELYFINFEGESLIRLIMRSKEIEWTPELIERQEN